MLSSGAKSGQHWFHVYEWVKILITFVAAAWVLFAYRGEVEQRRIDRTLDLANIYFTGEVMAAHQYMKSMLMKKDDIPLQDFIQKKISTEDFGDRLESAASRVAAENPQHVYVLSEFFFEMARCVEAERCDEETTCRLFGDRIDNFVFFHGGKIMEWENNLVIEPRIQTLESLIESGTCDAYVRGELK